MVINRRELFFRDGSDRRLPLLMANVCPEESLLDSRLRPLERRPWKETSVKARSAFLLIPLASGMLPGACSVHSDSSGNGGSSANGGPAGTGGSAIGSGGAGTSGASGNSGGGQSCPNVTACGGNAVGTWTVASSCLTVAGTRDLSSIGLGCSSPVTGSLQVTGTLTIKADGTFVDNTTTSGEEHLT